MANIDNLNFKVILDDKEFNDKVRKDIKLAQDLNTRLSNLLQIKAKLTNISAQDAASAKRHSDLLAKQAIDQERIKKAAAATALEEEKVRTQAAKTASEMERTRKAAAEAALAEQRVATEAQRTATATNNAAVSAQRLRTETQRTATETQRTATATQNTANATARAELAQRRLRDYSSQTARHIQTQSRIMNELKGYALGYLSIHGASQLLSSLVRVTGEFELQKTTLAAMIGDLNKAEGIITRIQGLAVESPFQFKELTTYAKQLSAFSVPAEELYDTTKMLADISAGLGVGMDRIVLAYGQVRSAAFLRGQEVRQFTEAGIPILDELAKQFSELEGRAVSTGEVFDKISARLVPFEMVAKVFKDMTSEGGKFFNMQEVQAETLKGKISNLKDAYEVMLNEIGSGQEEKLKGAVDWARRLMQNYEETGRTLVELVAAYGIYRTTLILTSNHITTLTRAHAALRAQMRNLTQLLTKNPYAALAVGVTATIGLIYKLGKEMKSQSAISETLSKSQSEYAKNVEESTVALDALYAKINLAKKGTKDYNTALGTIQRTYAPYIEQLRSEGVEVDNLATLYDELTKKIKESAQARFVESARKDLDQTYAQGLSDILNGTGANGIYNLKRAMESLDLNEAEGVVLRMFLSGSATWEEISEKYGELAEKVEDAYVSLGEGSSGPMKAKDYLDILKNSLTNLTNQYTTAIAVVDEFAIKMKETPKPVVLATGWRKTVQDTLTDLGLDEGASFGLWAKDTTKSTEYVEDMIKRYKELKEEIKWVSSFDTEQADRLEKNKDAIEAVARALKIDIKNLAANDSETTESKEEKRIKRLIDSLRQLQDQYEKLKAEGASDESIRTLFKGLYPELVTENGEDFVTDLKYLERASRLVEELEKLNPEAAKKLIVDLGGDQFSQTLKDLKNQNEAYKASAKAAGEYFNALRKWTTEDFNINGEGIAFDVSKIASELNEKINEIKLRSTKAKEIFDQIDVDSEQEVAKVKDIFVKEFGADAWEEFWQSYQSEGFKAIENLADKQKEYEKKVAQEKLTDIAKKFAKEKLEPLNLTDWGDKSLGQIKRIQESLKSLLVNPVVFPPEVQKQVDSLGLSMDGLYEIVKAIFGENYKDVLDEKLKKIQDRAKNAVTVLGDIGGAFSNIGSAIGSEALENIGLYIDGVEEVVSALVDCDYLWEEISKMMDKTSEASEEAADSIDDIASSTDWITVILKAVLVLAEQISNAVAIAEEGTWALRKAAMEYQKVLHEIALEQADTIWGENYTQKLKEGFDYVKTTYEAYHNYIKRLMQEDFGGVKHRSFNLNDNSWDWLVVKDFAGLVDMYDLMDEAGNLDMDWIKGNLDALIKSTAYNGLKLKKYLEQDLEHLVELYDAYQKAYAEIKATIQEMMSETANDFADNMIDSFLRVGDAADDLGKVFENLGTTLIKTFMVDFLIDNVLGKYTNELTDLFEKKALGAIGLEEFNEKFADIAGRIETEIADYAPMFNDLLAKAQSSGLLSSNIAEETASLASGIKGVTEDTANLLASYLNAIRADVSYAKGQREQSNAYLQQILTQVSAMNAPSLVEYQQQIAANTFNTAIATQAILSRLDSVITSEGGFDAIRTYS